MYVGERSCVSEGQELHVEIERKRGIAVCGQEYTTNWCGLILVDIHTQE